MGVVSNEALSMSPTRALLRTQRSSRRRMARMRWVKGASQAYSLTALMPARQRCRLHASKTVMQAWCLQDSVAGLMPAACRGSFSRHTA